MTIVKVTETNRNALHKYAEFARIQGHNAKYLERLRTCSAYVKFDTDKYYLYSYDTLVAVIHDTGKCVVCVDMLRYVYGYTATSAQHIAKFFTDYTPSNPFRKIINIRWTF